MENTIIRTALSIAAGLTSLISGCSDPCQKYAQEDPEAWKKAKYIYQSINLTELTEKEKDALDYPNKDEFVEVLPKDNGLYKYLKCVMGEDPHKNIDKAIVFLMRVEQPSGHQGKSNPFIHL